MLMEWQPVRVINISLITEDGLQVVTEWKVVLLRRIVPLHPVIATGHQEQRVEPRAVYEQFYHDRTQVAARMKADET